MGNRTHQYLLFSLLILLFFIVPVSAACNQPPSADFVGYNTSVCPYEVIQFNDTSDYYGGIPTDWWWLFGDSQDSHLQNPTHYYDTPGVYDVSLWVQDLCGTNVFNDTELKTEYITVIDCYSADFAANRTCTIGVPAFVFINQTCDIDLGKSVWVIGDGSGWSVWNGTHWVTDADGQFDGDFNHDLNVFLNFTSYGTYTVTHTCQYAPPIGTQTETKTDYITIGFNGTFCDCLPACCGCTEGGDTLLWAIVGAFLIALIFILWRRQ